MHRPSAGSLAVADGGSPRCAGARGGDSLVEMETPLEMGCFFGVPCSALGH